MADTRATTRQSAISEWLLYGPGATIHCAAMLRWLQTSPWWLKVSIPIGLIIALLVATGWSYRLAGWRRFAEADARWHSAGAPDDLDELLTAQPCDLESTARWFAWRKAHVDDDAANELHWYAEDIYESVISRSHFPCVVPGAYQTIGPTIEKIFPLLSDPGCDASHSGRRHVADRLHLPTGDRSRWSDWQKLNAHRMVQAYLLCKVAFTDDVEQLRALLRLMDEHVDRLAEADTIIDAMVRISISRLRDQAWFSCIDRVDIQGWHEKIFNGWLNQTVPYLARLPTVLRRDHLWVQRTEIVAGQRSTGLWTLLDNKTGRKHPGDALLLWLEAGYQAADLSDAALRWHTWRPTATAAPPQPERSLFARHVGLTNYQETTITCWEEDARQQAVRLAARLLLRQHAGESLPSDHHAWLQQYPTAAGALGRAALRYECLGADSFRIGIDPSGPLVWPGIASRYADGWLITIAEAEAEPPMPRSRRRGKR